MGSPRLLINLSVLVSILSTFGFVLLVWSAPYVGFELERHDDSNYMTISRVDEWAASSGLRIGDEVKTFTAPDGTHLEFTRDYYPANSFESRRSYENQKAEMQSRFRVHRVISQDFLEIGLTDGSNVHLVLNHIRPLSSLSWKNWFTFSIGLATWFLGAIIWAFRPRSIEGIFMVVSGFGLFMATLSAVASVFYLEMFFMHPIAIWLVTEFIGFGNFLYLGFGTCLLLHFPQKLKHADLWSKRLLGGLGIYTLITLLNKWQWDSSVSDQFLYFSYNEVYGPELTFYLLILFFCFLQLRTSRFKPVQRAQALWITLAWSLGPSLFFVFYLIPVLMGQDAMLSRTWTTLSLLGVYVMVVLGVGRFNFFQLEKHISAVYQWSLVTFLFFGLDALLVSLINFDSQTSTFVMLGLLLWVYLPIRQWFYRKLSHGRQLQYQRLFNDAVASMVEGSLTQTNNPESAWHSALQTIFVPNTISVVKKRQQTKIAERGQVLNVSENRFSPALSLEFAGQGSRLFTKEDAELVETLALLFTRLYDFRNAYFAGQTQERERIRRDLHDHICNKLLSIIHGAKNQESRRIAQETIKQLRELIRAMRNKPVLLVDAIAELRHLSEESCGHAGLSMKWQDDLSLNNRILISSNLHLNLLNIIRTLINNSTQHAQASKIIISAQQADDHLTITLKDDGKDFSENEIRPGNGFYNIDARIREINATIQWQTSTHTEAVLRIPLEPSLEHVEPARVFSL